MRACVRAACVKPDKASLTLITHGLCDAVGSTKGHRKGAINDVCVCVPHSMPLNLDLEAAITRGDGDPVSRSYRRLFKSFFGGHEVVLKTNSVCGKNMRVT